MEGNDDLLQVIKIRLFNTVLKDRRNIEIIASNGIIMQSKFKNLSRESFVFTDVYVSVAYDSDISKVKTIIKDTLDKIDGIIKDKSYLIGVNELGDSGVDILVSAPCRDKDHVKLKLIMREEILKALRNNGVEIPFPQIEVKVLDDK